MATHPPDGPGPARAVDDDDARHRESELKTALRARYRARRGDLSSALRRAQSAAVAEHVARFVAGRHAAPPPPRLGLYRAIRTELDAADVARHLEERLGAAVEAFFPRCQGQTLVFAPAEPGGWVHGRFGLLEPAGAPVEPRSIDWLLVPALAVDRSGTRLGYGGGFYDRFLERHPFLVERTIAVVFDVQVAPDGELPREPFDVAVAWLATPDGVSPTSQHSETPSPSDLA